ncbi:MAG: 50S ribosomal protein L22 [Erysipelotrichaceae bacterium]
MAKKTNEAVVEEVKPAVTEARATAKTVRISARKVRYVLALVRGKDVDEALGILKFTPNGAADVVAKVVKSAKANAANNHGLDESKLYIKECYANEGFTIKRFMPRAKGSASAIMKRTSHITVVVAER